MPRVGSDQNVCSSGGRGDRGVGWGGAARGGALHPVRQLRCACTCMICMLWALSQAGLGRWAPCPTLSRSFQRTSCGQSPAVAGLPCLQPGLNSSLQTSHPASHPSASLPWQEGSFDPAGNYLEFERREEETDAWLDSIEGWCHAPVTHRPVACQPPANPVNQRPPAFCLPRRKPPSPRRKSSYARCHVLPGKLWPSALRAPRFCCVPADDRVAGVGPDSSRRLPYPNEPVAEPPPLRGVELTPYRCASLKRSWPWETTARISPVTCARRSCLSWDRSLLEAVPPLPPPHEGAHWWSCCSRGRACQRRSGGRVWTAALAALAGRCAAQLPAGACTASLMHPTG